MDKGGHRRDHHHQPRPVRSQGAKLSHDAGNAADPDPQVQTVEHPLHCAEVVYRADKTCPGSGVRADQTRKDGVHADAQDAGCRLRMFEGRQILCQSVQPLEVSAAYPYGWYEACGRPVSGVVI